MIPFPHPRLLNREIVLRKAYLSDVRAITAACNDPPIAQNILGMPVSYQEADAVAWVCKSEIERRAGNTLSLIIYDLEENVLLGAISVNLSTKLVGKASIGYWLAPQARGRGVATRSVNLFMAWSEKSLGVREWKLFANLENMASQKVALRCGFEEAGESFERGRRSIIFTRIASTEFSC